ncbi:unnamed protein product [Adineta steineri]|uniref:RING-type E3 ubiquitin transferase n=1 Tax=Adineta steineri TaxID=433720 RepID=A0A819PZ05_9BILA|nr:unnamed protein product [Adineta steineri]
MDVEQPYTKNPLKRRRLLFSKAKLKAVSRTSALLSGFAMVAMVEISLDDHKNAKGSAPLLVVYSVITCLLVGVHLLALMISTCILPQLEADSLIGYEEYESHETMHIYIELAWILSTGFGIFLFLVEIAIVCWVKFYYVTRPAAIATTIVIVPVIILFCIFSLHFYRRLVSFKLSRHQDELNEIENTLTVGNKNFLQKKYNDAIHCYNQALKQNGEKATYYVNRALCYIKLKQWDKVYQDARHCLDLDPNYIKAHAYLGQYYLEQQRYDEAITCFKQALELAKIQNKNFGDEIQRLLRYAQKRRFSLMEQKRIENEISLQTYLRSLIQTDKEQRMQLYIEKYLDEKETESTTTASQMILKQYLSKIMSYPNQQTTTTTNLSSSISINPTIHNNEINIAVDQQLEQALDDIEQFSNQSLNEMNNLFNEVDIRRKRREIPEYLTCKLCYDLMKDPVITPFGITYCRSCIEENLYKVSHLDPIANKPLVVEQLINNLVLKEIIEKFIKENEWVNSECF